MHVAKMSHISDSKYSTYKEVAKKQVWKDAMVEEFKSIMKNDVLEVVPKPKEKSFVTSTWLYRIKDAVNGSIEKYKSIFVGCGFSQKEGIKYDETFDPMAKYNVI